MNNVIVYQDPNTDVLSVITLVDSGRPSHVKLLPSSDGRHIEVITPYTDDEFIDHCVKKQIPKTYPFLIIDKNDLPKDKIFFSAWCCKEGAVIVDVDKAKTIAHNLRRKKRDNDFIPYDRIISLMIPGSAMTEAEIQREKIRVKYNSMQEDIDMASSTEDLIAALNA